MNLSIIVHVLVSEQLKIHPLPWRIERDWAYQVVAVDGAVIAQSHKTEVVECIVQVAEEINREQSSALESTPEKGHFEIIASAA